MKTTEHYPVSYLYAKDYQIWCRFDEVLTKTSWAIFWHTLYYATVFRQTSNY